MSTVFNLYYRGKLAEDHYISYNVIRIPELISLRSQKTLQDLY